MEPRRPIPWTALAYFAGLAFFLLAVSRRASLVRGSHELAITLVMGIVVWFGIAALIALGVRRLAGASRVRFVTAFAWTFLGLGAADTSVWIFFRALRSEVFQNVVGVKPGPEAARTSGPRRIERPRFSFDYPANWSIDDSDPNQDEGDVTLVTPNGSMLDVYAFDDHVLPDRIFDSCLDRLRKNGGEQRRETDFERWGPFDGRGKELRSSPFGTAQTFRIRGLVGGGAFVVVQFSLDEAVEAEAPGFTLIRATFVFRPQ